MLDKHKDKVLSAFLAVDNQIQALCRHILLELKELPIWAFDGKESMVEERGRVLHILKHFSVSMGLSANETLHCPGAVAAKSDTLILVKAVNQAKLDFKRAINEVRVDLKEDTRVFVHQILESAGFRGIKLLQVTRTIPFIEYHPRRIAWALVKHTANKRRTTEELRGDLTSFGDGKNLEIQHEKLTALGHTTLVVHREIKDIWQYNISSFKQGTTSSFLGGRSSLPLFYLHDYSLPDPLVTLSKKPKKKRKLRADKKIEDRALLPSIHAYQYKAQESTKKS